MVSFPLAAPFLQAFCTGHSLSGRLSENGLPDVRPGVSALPAQGLFWLRLAAPVAAGAPKPFDRPQRDPPGAVWGRPPIKAAAD